jgi:hypothetical protein
MAQRVTLRKRQPYNTSSNRRRVVKTPGGKLVVHHLKKKAVSILICRRSGSALEGSWIHGNWDTLLAAKRLEGTMGMLSLDELEHVEERLKWSSRIE